MVLVWAEKFINLYFKQRPADITQKIYKKYGYKPFEYWYYELLYIMNRSWKSDDEYLINKYGSDTILFTDIDSIDRELILKSFYKYLGINKDMFPYNESDIPKLII